MCAQPDPQLLQPLRPYWELLNKISWDGASLEEARSKQGGCRNGWILEQGKGLLWVLHCARWGLAPPPPWGKRLEWFCTSLQNHSHLHLIFFSPAAHQGLLRSIYGASLGREHPPVGTGRPVGSPQLLLAAPWAQEGPRHRSSTAGPRGGLWRAAEAEQLCPRACTHHILFHLHVTHREHKLESPSRPRALADCSLRIGVLV